MQFITIASLLASTVCALPKPQLPGAGALPGLSVLGGLTKSLPLVPRQFAPFNEVEITNITVTIGSIVDEVIDEVKVLLGDLELALDLELKLFDFVTTTYHSVSTNTTTTVVNCANGKSSTTTTTTTTTETTQQGGGLISDILGLVVGLIDSILDFVKRELHLILGPFGLAVEIEDQILDIILGGINTFEGRVQGFLVIVPFFKN